jgi:hypothetical protein
VVNRTFEIEGERFGIRTTSWRFAEWLDYALAEYRVRRRSDPLYSVLVDEGDGDGGRVGRRFNVVYQGTGTVTRSLHLPTVAWSLLAELEAKLLREREDAVFTFAALVTRDDQAALLPSWLASYLTSLGRRITKAGLRLPIARWVAIDPDVGRVVPSTWRLVVPDDALSMLEADHGRPEAYDDRDVVREPVAVDAIITYEREAHELQPATRGATVAQLAAATANIERLGPVALQALTTLVGRARTFRLGGLGRPQQGLDALVQALGDPVKVGAS